MAAVAEVVVSITSFAQVSVSETPGRETWDESGCGYRGGRGGWGGWGAGPGPDAEPEAALTAGARGRRGSQALGGRGAGSAEAGAETAQVP